MRAAAVLAVVALVYLTGSTAVRASQMPQDAAELTERAFVPVHQSPALLVVPRASGGIVASATWYCRAGVSRCTRGWPAWCMCAAVSPGLRRALGSWIVVSRGSSSVRVRVIDCLCSGARGIDLYASAFRRIAPLWMGRVAVTLRSSP